MINSSEYNYIDLCAGIGGFHQAFQNYGECLLSSDIDKYCKQSYLENYQTKLWENDVKLIDPIKMPDFQILCAGFPCQAFSLAGKQKGFADTRGTIFFDLANMLATKRPKMFLMENVKNLLNHDKKNTFKTIQNTLTELDYYHEYFLINAQHFVPQRRERVYIVGIDKKAYSEKVFKNIINEIKESYIKKQQEPLPTIKEILEKNIPPKYTISDKLWNFLQEHAKKHASKGNGFGYGLVDPTIDTNTRTITARYHKDGSEILIKQPDKNPRKLTPRECARLMGYPDNYKIVVSDTQAYKQFGNSVVVPVVKMLADIMVKNVKKADN